MPLFTLYCQKPHVQYLPLRGEICHHYCGASIKTMLHTALCAWQSMQNHSCLLQHLLVSCAYLLHEMLCIYTVFSPGLVLLPLLLPFYNLWSALFLPWLAALSQQTATYSTARGLFTFFARALSDNKKKDRKETGEKGREWVWDREREREVWYTTKVAWNQTGNIAAFSLRQTCLRLK